MQSNGWIVKKRFSGLQWPMIISASRRTDIPRFFAKELLNNLINNSITSINPFNKQQRKDIDLEVIRLFVFWTRYCVDMGPVLSFLEQNGISYYFLFTITAYPRWLEPGRPEPAAALENFISLSESIGTKRVVWRYDPILLTEKLSFDYHLENFSSLAAALGRHTGRVIISMYDSYAAAERRLKKQVKQSGRLLDYSSGELSAFLNELKGIAAGYGLSIQCCADELISAHSEIPAGACIYSDSAEKDPGQRKQCLCAKSIDIGIYNSCKAGCLYCYARR